MRRFLAWFELPVLVLIGATSAAVWVLVEIADEVREGESGAFDEWLLRALRNPADLSDPLGPRWVEEMARDFTALGGVAILTLIAAACVVYLALMRRRNAALFLLVAVGGGMLLSSVFKAAFDRAAIR